MSVLRLVVGFLFLQHGTAKLFGVPDIALFDTVSLGSLLGVASPSEASPPGTRKRPGFARPHP